MPQGCPKHPEFSKACYDARCQAHWSPTGAPTPEEQLTMWVGGKPVCPNTRHECCPDFSCCKPDMLWPKDRRLKFQAAGQGEREKMMMGGLGDLVGSSAYVTRGNPTDRE